MQHTSHRDLSSNTLRKQSRRFLRFDPSFASSHVRCRRSCGIGGDPCLVNSILRKTTLRTKAALSCTFSGSTSDGWTRANSISDQGSSNGAAHAVASSACQSLLWFTSHKLASSLMLLRASALTFLACWVPLGSTGLFGFSRKTPNKQNFCPRHSEALRNRVSAAVASLKIITRTGTNAPQNQSGSSLYAWRFISAQRARLAQVLATRLAGRASTGTGGSLVGSRTE